MFDDLREQLRARFGTAGLRRLDAAGTNLPAEPRSLLAECGVPRQVGPYFLSSDGDPVRLGAYAEAAGMAVADEEKASWCRIGWDRGAQICVDGSGAVRAEFTGIDAPGAVVNESLPAFLESLVVLDEALSLTAAARSVPESASHIRLLLRQLANIEMGTVQSADSWWSRVIEDIRHTASHAAFASFEVLDAKGGKRIVSDSGALCLHPEERIWNGLREAGVGPEQVLRVHTELEACFMPGHYCSVWMAQAFPQATFTHSFAYGQSAESREAGFLALLRYAASSQQ